MLEQSLQNQLRHYLEKTSRPIEIIASLDESEGSREMESLLEDLVLLSENITLTQQKNSNARTPSFGLNSPHQDIHLRFAGLPMGHEFTSLVLALLQVGGYPPKITEEMKDLIQSINTPLHFETYFSQSCQNCPEVVQALNLMSVLNPLISHVAIDGGFFPKEIEDRQIMAVPSVYLNGQIFGQGRMTLEEVVAKVSVSSEGKMVEKINQKQTLDVLVIGAGPAGASSAIYSARKGIKTALLAERLGGQVLDTLSIENFISIPETEGPRFASALEEHIQRYDIDVITQQKASKLEKINDLFEVSLESGAKLRAKKVILAPGARWKKLNVPGEEEYKNKGVAYCPHCDGPLFKGKRVAVIGGGNSGVEAAIDLAGIVKEVFLIEYDVQLRADDVLQKKLRSLPNVHIFTSAKTNQILGEAGRVSALMYEDRNNGEIKTIALEGVFVQIGLLPNTEWLKQSVQLSPRNEIIINEKGATSWPGVFAAGDATTVPYKQIVIAVGQGATAALGAFEELVLSP